MRREYPRAGGIKGGFEGKLTGLRCNPCGQGQVEAGSAHLRGNAGFKLQKRRAGSLPIEFCTQVSKLFKQRVNRRAQSAGAQTTFMASVEPRTSNSQSTDGGILCGVVQGLVWLGLVIQWEAAQQI